MNKYKATRYHLNRLKRGVSTIVGVAGHSFKKCSNCNRIFKYYLRGKYKDCPYCFTSYKIWQ